MPNLDIPLPQPSRQRTLDEIERAYDILKAAKKCAQSGPGRGAVRLSHGTAKIILDVLLMAQHDIIGHYDVSIDNFT